MYIHYYLKYDIILIEMVKIFSLEGNIGSGKSTLIRLMMQTKAQFIYMLEPVDEWNNIVDKTGENILTKFYRDQKKYSFSFQMMAYISRLHLLREAIKSNTFDVFYEKYIDVI